MWRGWASLGLCCRPSTASFTPDEVVEPYDLTLNTMLIPDRRRWADKVLAQLYPHLDSISSTVFLAGHRYREFLESSLRRRGLDVSVPMEGLKIGEQLSWLDRKLRD